MQDTDKTVRVECAFTAEDQTVSFKPTAGVDGREDSGGGISVTYVYKQKRFRYNSVACLAFILYLVRIPDLAT